ncbi:MAG: M23 family metallopeptidase, partial [Deltaproteobacteria bacterium]|nr:M23 family metallopeptidase [Deltaproteobacteria bacterium]
MACCATSSAPRGDRPLSASLRIARVALLLACFALLPSRADEIDCPDGVCIEVEREEAGASLYAVNQLDAPVSLQLDFPILENMKSSEALPVRAVVPAGTRKRLVEIRAHERADSFSWRSRWDWTTGVLGARHDANARYWLPWAPNFRFEVGQAIGGSFSHTGKSHFAFDFWTPSGTPIRAARGGTVIRAIENFRQGGLEERFKKRANQIFILHDDGTIARYLHLKQGGAHVDVGDRVAAGDLIGYSGNTGYSQSPHLHFDVFTVDEDLEWQTVYIRFA